MSVYFNSNSTFCPYEKPTYINQSYNRISKTFIMFDKNITFTGIRDSCDPRYFILEQKNIYQSGTTEVKTLRLNDAEINCLFYTLDNK